MGAPNFPLRTIDIDFLIPNPYRGKKNKKFINDLENLGFKYDFDSSGALYLWNADLKIEFITPLKGKGAEDTIKIKPLGFNATGLRFVDLLLNEPIILVDGGIKIKVPNSANFCLHKLIIASRRKKIDKSQKDLQQAILTSVIADHQQIKNLFDSLPKNWKIAISKSLEKAKKEMPLLHEEINNLEFTLQNTE